LDYMHARSFSATIGRFLSVDKIANDSLDHPSRWNRYSYASNNPVLRLDSDGLKDHVYVVNTLGKDAFDKGDRAALAAGVEHTRFAGNVTVIGPFASNDTALAISRQADETDFVAVIIHSGELESVGGMMSSQNSLDALHAGADKGDLSAGISGNQLASAVNDGQNPTMMIAGCQSGFVATTVARKAATTVYGTTNDAIAPEQGRAVVAVVTAIAHGGSPSDVAVAGSREYKTPPKVCPPGDSGCNTSRAATLQPYTGNVP
jgi:hypothetical protein